MQKLSAAGLATVYQTWYNGSLQVVVWKHGGRAFPHPGNKHSYGFHAPPLKIFYATEFYN